METISEETPPLRELFKEKPYKREQKAAVDAKSNNVL